MGRFEEALGLGRREVPFRVGVEVSNFGINSLLEVKLVRRRFGLNVVRGGPVVVGETGFGGMPETEGASRVVWKLACNRDCAKNLETLSILMGESVPEKRRNSPGVISLRSS